jgi:hypothetical protein
MELKIADIIEELKKKKANDSDFVVQKKDIKVLNGSTSVSVRNKEYIVENTAKTTLCKILGMPKHYFGKYPVLSEFSEHANTLLNSKPLEEILIRTRGDSIRACLSPKYAIYDNDQVLEEIRGLEGNLPQYKLGIIRDSDAFSTFMLTFGNPVMEQDKTYSMLRFSNSEVGLSNLQMEMGLFRLICTNGLVRRERDAGFVNWEHSPRNVHKVHTFINFAIDKGINMWTAYQVKFEKAREVKVSRPFLETINDLIERNLVTQKFANRLIEADKSIPVLTRFDAVNTVTREAQNEKTWGGQTRYENLGSYLLDEKIPC